MSKWGKSRGSCPCEPGAQEGGVPGDAEMEDFKVMGLEDIT